MITRPARIVALPMMATVAVLAAAPWAAAQSLSNAATAATAPPPPPAGPPCFGIGLSVDGDIFDPGSPYGVPMGPVGCGLGWPVAGGPPFNVDAFSTGMSAAVGAGFPYPAGTFSLLFATDDFTTGDPGTTCTPFVPGPFVTTDVGAEAGDLFIGGTTDVGADVFATAPNGAPWGVPAAPAPGSAPNFQLLDGDGFASIPFGLAVGAPLGLVEPGPLGDSIDAVDAAPIAAWDFIGADAVPDLPVYFSVDPATAAAVGPVPFGGPVTGADIFVTVGGVPGLYAPAFALGLGAPADDVDALVVLDLLGDGVYAPPGDIILYSLSPASFAIGMPDCSGLAIQEGDILTEGTPFGFAGVPCVVIPQEDAGLWSARACGPNPASGGSDNVWGADVVFPAAAPPTTTTTSTTSTTGGTTTTTSITSTTTTTLPFPPLCAAAPEPDVSCRLADASGAGKSSIQIKDKSPDAKDQLKWKWSRGVATTTADFKSPDSGTATYRLCVYDAGGKLQELDLEPGGVTPMCAGKPCWKATGTKGFKYKNKAGSPDGITQAKFKEGVAGKAQVQIKAQGKGGFYGAPATAGLTLPVVLQLLIDDGITTECFKTTFSSATKLDAQQLKAKGP